MHTGICRREAQGKWRPGKPRRRWKCNTKRYKPKSERLNCYLQMLCCITSAAGRTDRTGRNSASYFGSLRFKFRPRDWPYWMIIVVVFLSSSRDDCFLPHIFQFVVHCSTCPSAASTLKSTRLPLRKPQIHIQVGTVPLALAAKRNWCTQLRKTWLRNCDVQDSLRSAKHLSMP